MNFKIKKLHNFDNVEFNDKSITFFAGLNGTGKSTLLNLIEFAYKCKYTTSYDILFFKIQTFSELHFLFENDSDIEEKIEIIRHLLAKKDDYEKIRRVYNEIILLIRNRRGDDAIDYLKLKLLTHTLEEEATMFLEEQAKLYINNLNCNDELVEFTCWCGEEFKLTVKKIVNEDMEFTLEKREINVTSVKNMIFKKNSFMDNKEPSTHSFPSIFGSSPLYNYKNDTGEVNNVDDIDLLNKIDALLNFEYNLIQEGYYHKKLKRKIKPKNVATGIVVFKYLIELFTMFNISRNAVVILDEPDSFLHPEWQYILSEVIQLISKERNIKFIITSHNALFAEAFKDFGNISMNLLISRGEVYDVKSVNAKDDVNEMLVEFAHAYNKI